MKLDGAKVEFETRQEVEQAIAALEQLRRHGLGNETSDILLEQLRVLSMVW